MPIDTSIKYLHSGMTGAPSMTGAGGTLIAVLDACLVNGFGTGTVDSIVIAGGIATVTRASGHPFEVDSVAEIAGATVSGGSINGQQKVLTVANVNTYTFDATGLANQTATGTITHKVAALGWSKVFSGTNLAAYRSPNVAGTGVYLRVDDNNAMDARVVGYETMTDISTGAGPFPTTAQVSGGGYWPKADAATGAVRRWVVYGDDRFFYFFPLWSNAGNYGALYGFGDPVSFKSPDPYQAIIQLGTSNVASGSSPGSDLYSSRTDTAGGLFICRGVSGLGGSVPAYPYVASPFPAANIRSGNGGMLFPSPADNGLYLSPMTTIANSCVRARLPGLYHSPQQLGGINTFALNSRVQSVVNLPGRTLRALSHEGGVGFVDVTGPIR